MTFWLTLAGALLATALTGLAVFACKHPYRYAKLARYGFILFFGLSCYLGGYSKGAVNGSNRVLNKLNEVKEHSAMVDWSKTQKYPYIHQELAGYAADALLVYMFVLLALPDIKRWLDKD